MCGRFALTAPASRIAEVFEVDVLPDVLPRYNIAPSQKVAAVVREDGQRKMRRFRWGLIPVWAKDPKIGSRTINARAETVATKPAFRSAFRRRRALVVADGFYEWAREGRKKIPHLIQLHDGGPFAMAGLWDRWIDPESQEEVRSCSIVTTAANDRVRALHDRMPVILPPTAWDTWLDPENHEVQALQELLAPPPSELIRLRPVSTRVNNARHEGPECQGPPDDEESG